MAWRSTWRESSRPGSRWRFRSKITTTACVRRRFAIQTGTTSTSGSRFGNGSRFASALCRRLENQLLLGSFEVDRDASSVLERAEEELVAQGPLDLFLDDSREWARAEVGVVALLREITACRLRRFERDVSIAELFGELFDELVDDVP